MIEKNEIIERKAETDFSRQIAAKAVLKRKAQRNSAQGVWYGLGMTGLIGWSVVVPTLVGTAFGIWLDNRYRGSHSWTLTLLVVGLTIGCLNAWYWVSKEENEIREQQKDDE